MGRGKNAVIVGDPNQMPPTSFFAGNKVDEDNLDIEDLDSILDDCLALGMPSAYLHWHYRSRHESLIAFSNQEFYENSMLTFPSVNDREKRVSLVKVEGFFDRGKGRVNEGEAKAIVAEIRRRYEDPERKKQTIGVVTFNISQQTLIEDLLLEEYQKDAAFDRVGECRRRDLVCQESGECPGRRA
ncbi:MAG: DEAD/DEAH box helicase [Enterocloster sp.]